VTAFAFSLDDVLVSMLGPEGVADRLEQGHASRALCMAGLHHDDAYVRRLAAEQGLGFPDVLAASMTHADVRVRMAVVEHPNTPEIVSVRLALDAPADVRKEVAIRTKSPSAAELLGRDTSMRVRVALARRDDLDAVLVTRLARDPHPKVRAAIARHAKPAAAQHALVNDPMFFVLIALTRNPFLHADVAMLLAQHAEHSLRRNIAYFTRYPEVLEALAHDPDLDVRRGVAMNPATTVATARILMNGRSPRIRSIVKHIHGDALLPTDVTPAEQLRVLSS
jgi:hypothetical protein